MSGIEHTTCKGDRVFPISAGNMVFDSAAVKPERLVTIGGSRGALDTLLSLVAALPPDCPAAFTVALHGTHEMLVQLLRARSMLPVRWASTASVLEPGVIHVAPPRRHLVVNPDATLTVSAAPRQDCFRPSIDWMFESAAASFCEAHAAIVLSGTMTDGAQGVRSTRRLGGIVLVQDPRSCEGTEMPAASIGTGAVAEVLDRSELAEAIARFAGSPTLRPDPRDIIRRLRMAASSCVEQRARLQQTMKAVERTVSRMGSTSRG